MTDPATSWIAFEERSPTEDELNSDRVVGYFVINGFDGTPVTDFHGKLFWNEEDNTWAIEIFRNSLRLTAPDQFEQEPVKPTHWCMVPALPANEFL